MTEEEKYMKDLYLVIFVGYEGIERLVLPTMDKQEAIDKVNQLRNEIDDAKKKVIELDLIEYDGEDWYEESKRIDNFLKENPEYYEIMNLARDNPDFYCVQQYDGENFNCVCKELGIEINKTILY